MRLWIWVFFLLLNVHATAQDKTDAAGKCSTYKQEIFGSLAKTTIASPEEDNYDVRYVKLDLSLSNESVAISAVVTTTAIILSNTLKAYVFELNDSLQIDKILIDGKLANFTHLNGIGVAQLPTQLNRGDTFTSQVYYHGQPKTGNGFFDASGINNVYLEDWKARVTYTLSEPYASSDWWPCKQSLKDKIDSADIWITIPGGLKAGSNGVLQKITILPDGRQRYEWHTAYSIDYYLLSVSVGAYTEDSYKIALPGVKDSMLITNYIYNTPGAKEHYKPGLDSVVNMIQLYSKLFGTYPFYKEKYGHCLAPLFGGMEHQTMTTCGYSNNSLISHELAHQWFGDYVTCASWKDIWLNEGMASYAEYIYFESYDKDSAARHMQRFHKKLLPPNEAGGTVYTPDTSSYARIFDGRLSYNKAAAVIHTLRYLIDDDNLFFTLLKTYLQQYAFGNASTQDFVALTNKLTQKDFSSFFDQWLYKEGYPVYSTAWNKIGNEVYIKLKQYTTHPQSVPLFALPVELKLQSPEGDTIVRVMNTMAEQDYVIWMHKPVTGILIDPRNWLLNDDKGTVYMPELGINQVPSNTIMVLPNPATDRWTLVGLPHGCDMVMTDATGKVIMTDNNGNNSGKVIYAGDWPKGVYVLHLQAGNDKRYVKLVKL